MLGGFGVGEVSAYPSFLSARISVLFSFRPAHMK